MPGESRLIVNENEIKIGRVRCTTNLDFWNGEYMSCGKKGQHLGLTKLRDGRFVLVYSFDDFINKKPYTDVISRERALEVINEYKHRELLKTYKFKCLLE